ncbi:MAG TPA: chorismate mutase family protein [Haliangium sp.]|nr:chorismate mutase family protein [Haliangium sp.]
MDDHLTRYRRDLDAIDTSLIDILVQRFDLCRRIAEYKREQQLPMMQPHRVEHVKQRCAAMAAEYGMDTGFVIRLYTLIIDEACRLEDDIIDAGREGD